MRFLLYQIDAFTDRIFSGNPAAVIPLETWLPDELLQNIARENNLSETAFIVPSTKGDCDFNIRWFTPQVEINLCGHATLASAYVLFKILKFRRHEIKFGSQSGILKVIREGEIFVMDFPSWKPERIDDYPADLGEILGNVEIIGVYKNRDVLVELQDENAVRNCKPDFSRLKNYTGKLIITAPGNEVDFVSRFFAPGVGIDEDPVTGSAHSQLIPFWCEKLGKNKMHALQLSERTGEIWCEQSNAERVQMSGSCVFYMKGEIEI